VRWPHLLLLAAPVALALEIRGGFNPVLIFLVSGLAMIPLAGLLGQSTEAIAIHTGPKIGGLLNATFGNAAELIITVVALREGLINVVKASIVGSIVGNILIVLGASLFFGGLRWGSQKFDAKTANTNATMLMLMVVALAVPAMFNLSVGGERISAAKTQLLSEWLAIVMLVVYALYLIYILRPQLPGADAAGGRLDNLQSAPGMGLPVALGLLGAATVGIVVLSEVLVGAIEPTAAAWGLSDTFIGVMLVPLVGNVAEHMVAVQAALRNKMDLSLGIAVGSGLQIALFVAPLLVLIGAFIGRPMNLVFHPFELIALIGAGLIAVLVTLDGESNWLEGVQLIALYFVLGVAFFFAP
jgi:Ca2+:H+ antiporter